MVDSTGLYIAFALFMTAAFIWSYFIASDANESDKKSGHSDK